MCWVWNTSRSHGGDVVLVPSLRGGLMLRFIKLGRRENVEEALKIINKHVDLLAQKTFYQLGPTTLYAVVMKKEDGEEVLVGVCGSRPLNKWAVEQVHTVVLPAYRSQGLGAKISTMMADNLLKRYGKVFCTVNSTNEHMISIKKKQGFEVEGTLRDHFGPGRTVLLLAKVKD